MITKLRHSHDRFPLSSLRRQEETREYLVRGNSGRPGAIRVVHEINVKYQKYSKLLTPISQKLALFRQHDLQNKVVFPY